MERRLDYLPAKFTNVIGNLKPQANKTQTEEKNMNCTDH